VRSVHTWQPSSSSEPHDFIPFGESVNGVSQISLHFELKKGYFNLK
jgi:hypothetical protein